MRLEAGLVNVPNFEAGDVLLSLLVVIVVVMIFFLFNSRGKTYSQGIDSEEDN